MATTKTATVTFRIDPAVKEALRTAAACEHRSIANMMEVLIRGYCERNDISILEQRALFEEADKPESERTAKMESKSQ